METNGSMKIDFQNSETNNGKFIDLNSLISKVKQEDKQNIYVIKTLQWLYIAIILIYVGRIVFKYNDISHIRLISEFFMVASLIAFALVLRKYHKEFKSIDYSLPMIEMLRKAADRYQLGLRKALILFIPIILIDIGITLPFFNNPISMSTLNKVFIVQAIYILGLTISGLLGVWAWRKKQKPLRDKALELIKELEN